MINLHAIYYRNIWPFEGKDCSLLFDQGKFLIKAPIGSGKSFLFFDGPSYALYRTANRNMLNIHSKEGEISLIFSEGENYYLVRRLLKVGKSKDSCSSQLFTITLDTSSFWATAKNPVEISSFLSEFFRRFTPSEWSLLQRDTNIIKEVFSHPELFHLEEVVMKNETDLQQSLDQLLPPKSVFLSTMFLLQDAENIFEMQPADRLTVLKNVFGLLGIDEAKEQVQDKKRELSYKLKSLQDHSQQDEKLRKWLKELKQDYCSFDEGTNDTFFTELEPFLDQLSLNDFSLNGLDIQFFLTKQQEFQEKEKSFLALQTSKSHLTKQITDHQDQIQKRKTEQTKFQSDLSFLEQKIASIDTIQIEKLKKEKAELYSQQEQLETVPTPILFEDKTYTNLTEVYTFIQSLKERWKDLANQVQQAELKLKNMELEAKNQQIKAEQLEQAKKRLKTFEGNIDQQATFSCDKIGTNCPFIKVINKQHFEQLEKQKAVLKEEIENIEKSLVFVPLSGDEDPTGRIEGGVDEPSIAEVKKATEEGVMKIKTFLTDINFKSREDTYAKKETLQKLINEKDQNIMRLEIETHKLQDYQQQKTAFQTSLQHLEVQIQEKMKEIEKIKADQAQLDQQISEYHPETLQAHLQTLTRILQIIHDIQQLIADATSTKNLVKDLQQQEKFLTNLYTILSKELLLFALEEYLPVLSEIINSYLIQVVDYQIAMKITETAEKLELEAKIYDEKGEREVKSLSWGQRTILKLVRMLAISSYLQTPLLFLDETINNLDIETVGKVSEMITNFVKQRTMKFYTVTHNTEIQGMGIWDQIVEI